MWSAVHFYTAIQTVKSSFIILFVLGMLQMTTYNNKIVHVETIEIVGT